MTSLARTARFGVFEADLTKRELRRQGHTVPVQQQPFSVLVVLLERAGELVSREELRNVVWPQDTFIDFGLGLNTAIKKIRVALGDSAETPRYVETLPRKGYRFIAAVSWEVTGQIDPISPTPDSTAAPLTTNSPTGSSTVGVPTRRLPVWSLAVLSIGLAIGIALAIGVGWWERRGNVPVVSVPVPLSSYPGEEQQPSFSPDGREVAFVWNGGQGEDLDIYIQPVGGGHPRRVTQDPGMDVSPAWSPDGRRIAFVRISGEGSPGVFVVPSTGGPEIQVTVLRARTGRARSWVLLPAWLAWSPDGAGLVVTDMEETGAPASLYYTALDGGSRRRLTNPQPGWIDSAPAFSPNHRILAFVRSLSILDADVFVLPLDAAFRAAGEPRRVTFMHRMTAGLTWSADGREIIFASGQPGASRLYRTSIVGEISIRPLSFSPENARWPAISSQGYLAYSMSQSDTNIWRAPIRSAAPPQRWIASTRDESDANYSPDGRHILFLSKRSGTNEIWIADSDGSGAWQLTDLRASFIGWPHWSPDGSTIVFDSPRDGTIAVFTTAATGGRLHKLTDGKVPCGAASYSRDGRWIYYHCFESGTRQMWRIPAQGGAAKRIVSGFAQMESHDGRYLYFVQSKTEGSQPLWRIPVTGGEPVQILPDVEPFNYAVAPEGIYFGSAPDERGLCVIRFLHLSTRVVSSIATYSGRPGSGMSVSPDGKWLLYSYEERRNADLMLVEGFH